MMLPGNGGLFRSVGSKIVTGGAAAVVGLREIARAFERRRHGHVVQALRHQLALPFDADEEEELVAVLVELSGDEGRAADVEAFACCSGSNPSGGRPRCSATNWRSGPRGGERNSRCHGSPWFRILVTTSICAPEERPNSAGCEFVITFISAIMSMLVVASVPPLEPVSTLVTPSSVKLFWLPRLPLAWIPPRPPVYTMPGSTRVRSKRLRPFSASSCHLPRRQHAGAFRAGGLHRRRPALRR